ncbi:MAG: MFS transporter [Candidatus Omnitrophica bacterium]|nr:MFS transporter [Candidatus Omnitrophota bacterium]MCF7893796.1 MFS transporter [Candidatus Omnitrophota bacterium]
MIIPYFKILAKRNFTLLWSGQITSQFGDKLTQLALVSLVGFFFKDSSSLGLAVIFSMTIIPVILFSPVTGVYVDRWDKRKTMYLCDFFRGVLIILIPILFLKAVYFPLICLIVFISATLGRFFIPAKMAFIPQITEKKDIFIANTLVSVTATTAAIFGIGLGGIIVDSLGLKATFYIDAITFFASAIFIFFIAKTEKKHFSPNDIVGISREVVENIKKSFVKELTEGIKYILATKETKYAFRTFLFLFSYLGGISTVYIRFIQNTIGTSSQEVKEVAFIGIFLGAGIFIGSLIYGRFAHKISIKKVIDLSSLTASFFLLFFVLWIKHNPYILHAMALSFFWGISLSPIFIGVNSLIHNTTKEALLGRIFSSLEFIAHLGFLITMFIASFLSDLLNPFTIITSIGIIGSIFSVIFLIKDAKSQRI